MRDVWIATALTVVLLAALLTLPVPEVRVVQLTEHDNGSAIHLKSGQEVVVNVESESGKPIEWKVTEADTRILEWGQPEYREHQPLRLGTPMEVIWRFRAVKKGTTALRLEANPHPTSNGTQAGRSFYVTISVE